MVEVQYQAWIVWVKFVGTHAQYDRIDVQSVNDYKPIRNDDDLKKVFRRLEKIFQAEEGTAQADERDVLVTLVEAYENRHYDFGPADPVEAIRFRMESSRD